MRRTAVIVLVLASFLTVGVAAGCGSGQSEPQVELVTPGQVIGQFERETGRPLERAPMVDEAFDQLGYGLNPSKKLLDRYGIFSVYVAKKGHMEAVNSLLRDKATTKALERDSEGVYWELDSNSGTWVAYKRYSRNVVLVWFSGSTARNADTRWARLDRVLTGLPG